jgi:hypothetical protein
MIIDSVVSSPLIFPKIIPNDWDRWWKLWTKEATNATKVFKNHNNEIAPWKGMNVYVKPGINNIDRTGYDIKNVFCPELFPSLFDNLDDFPLDIEVMQVVSSKLAVTPHTDHNKPMISIRSMLYDNNFTPTFYYQIDGNKKYQTLPDDTNTWMYHDNKYKHGSDYYQGHSKHLIIYHGKVKKDILKDNITLGMHNYNDYIMRDKNAMSQIT